MKQLPHRATNRLLSTYVHITASKDSLITKHGQISRPSTGRPSTGHVPETRAPPEGRAPPVEHGVHGQTSSAAKDGHDNRQHKRFQYYPTQASVLISRYSMKYFAHTENCSSIQDLNNAETTYSLQTKYAGCPSS